MYAQKTAQSYLLYTVIFVIFFSVQDVKVLAIGDFFSFLAFVTFVADVRISDVILLSVPTCIRATNTRIHAVVTDRVGDVFSLMKTCPFRLYKSSVIDQKPRPVYRKECRIVLIECRT